MHRVAIHLDQELGGWSRAVTGGRWPGFSVAVRSLAGMSPLVAIGLDICNLFLVYCLAGGHVCHWPQFNVGWWPWVALGLDGHWLWFSVWQVVQQVAMQAIDLNLWLDMRPWGGW